MYFSTFWLINENRFGRSQWGSADKSEVSKLIAIHTHTGYKPLPLTFYENATLNDCKIVHMAYNPHTDSISIQYFKVY